MTIPSAQVPEAGRAAPTEESAALRGLTLVLLALILLPGQDTLAKYLTGSISPGQINLARFLFQVLLTLPVLLYLQGWRGLVPHRFWPNILRGALLAVASTLYFISLKFMPMADALAILFVQPFVLTILSVVIDKEQIGWRRSLAVLAGFVGVLIVVQPSWEILGPVSLIPAGSGLTFAFYILLNRRLSRFDTPLTMQFTAGLAGLVVVTLFLAFGWLADVPELSPAPPVVAGDVALLAVMGVFGTAGHLLLVYAGRLTPSSLMAPMQYVEIVFAALLGYLVFGDFPSPVKWLGIAVIVGSGAYVFWRERRVANRRSALPRAGQGAGG